MESLDIENPLVKTLGDVFDLWERVDMDVVEQSLTDEWWQAMCEEY